MEAMKTTDYFQCDRCHVEYWLDSEGPSAGDSAGASQLYTALPGHPRHYRFRQRDELPRTGRPVGVSSALG
jgi:hypothetical protein